MVPDIAEYLSRVMNDRKFLESALENKENKILLLISLFLLFTFKSSFLNYVNSLI